MSAQGDIPSEEGPENEALETEAPHHEAKTVFMPPPARVDAVTRPPPAPAAPSPAPPPPPSPPPPVSAPPVAPTGHVQVGSVLNNIYEVKRLIGRGGMGEVFEGVNVNDDHDRVAIKVMLPSLAADPNVQAMFRKEARTLTRLSHPAVVQYRVLAQEPTLGVFYIVTEFIDGEPLSDVMGRAKPSSNDLRGLIRRMAEGLRAAHALGAVHRDMSPDNVLLPGGKLEQAKIIDFGIAKDLDPSKATIVGDGFAGKLGFVAPEQFGDFGREIGPWTDVYSVGLVILSVATGRNVDMGATLVEAIDKRRAGPDLSPIPDDLRPLLAAMVTADPAHRLRSMDEVLAMLDGAPAPIVVPPLPAKGVKPEREPKPAKPSKAPKPSKVATAPPVGPKPFPVVPAIAGGGVLTLALIGGLFFVLRPHEKPPVAPATTTPAAATPGAETARRAIEAALPTVSCSWLDIVSATPSGTGVAVALTGVAGSTQDANAKISAAAKAAGVTIASLDLADVSPADTSVCAVLDAFRPLRTDTSAGGRRLSTSQTKYTFEKQPDGSLSQKAVITMAIGDPSADFTLYGLDPTGGFGPLAPNRQWFADKVKDPALKDQVTDLGGDSYRMQVGATPPAGLQGLLLLTGKGPFDMKLIGAPPASRGAEWSSKVAAAAKTGAWKAEMVWYRTVNP